MDYGRRLLTIMSSRQQFDWVRGHFTLHDQPYVFAKEELEGMKIFLSEANDSKGARGNCIACHPPPQFTDHKFHNTGISQLEYDAVFGKGSFAALYIPDLSERNEHPEAFLPASVMHPNALDRFRSAPSKSKPGFADLGLWNILANPAFPGPQAALHRILCSIPSGRCEPASLLAESVGRFKTPSIRNLGHSQPYFHSGAADSIEDTLATYSTVSDLARAGKLRNADTAVKFIHLDADASSRVGRFLRALNEDYH